MSLYNMINGVNPATFILLPMYGKHPDEYPRFRDCFSDGRTVELLLRMGGDNGNCWEDNNDNCDCPACTLNKMLEESPHFLKRTDAEFDSTYCKILFSIPEEWEEDYKKIMDARAGEVSDAYVENACKIYPKIDGKLREIFRGDG